MDYNIEFVKESREQWLKYIPTVINRLAKDYNFYYSGNINKIKKDILDIIKENYDKNRHKIVLYQTSDKTRLFLVVYAKKRVSICTTYPRAWRQRPIPASRPRRQRRGWICPA